jgi:predicted transcriptional regulator
VNDVMLADREMDVMMVLWESGSGTVAEVREGLADALAYNTVLTVLRTLEKKGIVGHVEVGQAHRYVPLVERANVRRSALRRLVDKLFAGAPDQLLSHMVDERSLTIADLDRLRAQIKALDSRTTEKPTTSAVPSSRGAKRARKRGTT